MKLSVVYIFPPAQPLANQVASPAVVAAESIDRSRPRPACPCGRNCDRCALRHSCRPRKITRQVAVPTSASEEMEKVAC